MATGYKTEDGFVFKLQPDGSFGDGDLTWPSKKDFLDSMKKEGIKVIKIKLNQPQASLRSSKDKKFFGMTDNRNTRNPKV